MTLQPGSVESRLQALESNVERLESPVIHPGDSSPLPPVGVIADFIGPNWSADLRAYAARDQLPIPHAADREGYSPNDHGAYWAGGLSDYRNVMRALGDQVGTGARVYDFGGSTGRIFRHFRCQSERFEIWSSDCKVKSYLWNQGHMPSEIRSFLNGFTPPLPLPDKYFDLVTAFSVFTHIDELESAWLLELRRILKPGGLLYVTIHDEELWARMGPWMWDRIRESPAGERLNPGAPFPGPRSAFTFRTDSYYNCNVFHSHDYIRRQWGRFFEIVDIRPLEANASEQCAVLLTYED